MENPSPPSSANADNSLCGKRILLVDDNPGNLMALGLILKRSRYESQGAGDGEEAIELLGRADFDLLLSDIEMPNVDGFELLEWVRENRPGLPVLLMSGSVSGDGGQTSKRAAAQGAKGVLYKPFIPDDLERAVARALA